MEIRDDDDMVDFTATESTGPEDDDEVSQGEDPDEQDDADEDQPDGTMLHADYTRKTQELARQREELESDVEFARQMKEWAQSDPLSMIKHIEQFIPKSEPQQSHQFDIPEDVYGNERELYEQLGSSKSEMARLAKELEVLKQGLGEVLGQRERENMIAKARAEFGANVTYADLAAAVKATGQSDPIGAYATMILRDRKSAAAPVGSPQKPKTPQTNTRTADKDETSATKIFDALMKGSPAK